MLSVYRALVLKNNKHTGHWRDIDLLLLGFMLAMPFVSILYWLG